MSHPTMKQAETREQIQTRIRAHLRHPKDSWVDGVAVKPPRPTLGNVLQVLTRDPLYSSLYFDAFSGVARLNGERLSDELETQIAWQMDTAYHLAIRTSVISEACRYVALQRRRHPVQHYLNSLRWDRVDRLDQVLQTYMGAEDSPLARSFGAKWFLSAVRRILEPGCKVDTVLILAGRQGIGKSRGLRALCADPSWFSDTPLDLRSKDAYLSMRGVFIYEISELSSMRVRDAETVKAFLSAQVDRFRPPYGRHVVELPRQTVFCASTNESEFLDDPTGSRRMWVVKVSSVNVAAIEQDRDQLWAEAVHRVQKGEPHWLDEVEAVDLHETQIEYQRTDPWSEPVLAFLLGMDEATIAEVLTGIKIETAQQHRAAAMRVASILTSAGWYKRRVLGAPTGQSKARKREMRWFKGPRPITS